MVYLFVYGTLRRGYKLSIQSQVSKHLRYIGKAKVKAALYDLGAYPGAVKGDGSNEVVGDVFEVGSPELVLSFLDEYEGEEYQRVETRVRLRSGKWITAWMYWYKGEPQEKQRIYYKDYFNYLKNKKSAFINGAL